ncbi:MAG: hypothetical protein ACR2PS_00295 [Pseudomonadales bacterium]
MEQTAAFFREKLELDLEYQKPWVTVFRMPNKQAFDIYATRPDAIKVPISFGYGVSDIVLDKHRAQLRGVEFADELAGSVSTAAWEMYRDSEGRHIQLSTSQGEQTFDQSKKKLRVKSVLWVGYNVSNLSTDNEFHDHSFAGNFVVQRSDKHSLMKFSDGTYVNVAQKGSNMASEADYPILGLEVDDLVAGVEVLKRRGVVLVGQQQSRNGFTWQHFRGPDELLFKLIAVEQ